jgi:hypothetical protein
MGLQQFQADRMIVLQLLEPADAGIDERMIKGEAGGCGRRRRIRCGFFPAACRRRCRWAGWEYSVMMDPATGLR